MAKSSKPYFEPVDLKADFPAMERELLADWYKKGVVKKYLSRNKNSKKTFSFIDGPITANNPMAVHHAWGRTYKDLWRRYKNMQGFNQKFQNGFDCQGLWVEVEVEKELGFKNKKDIEAFGVAEFVQLCRDRVKKYSDIQTTQTKRLGNFMDWDNSYFTLSDDNNYMIWHFLKICNDLGWIYKGNDSAPWCPRCETAISQHEMLTEDYKELTHDSVFLAFPIVGAENEYLMVWTTTPWTIIANIAVAVDVDLEYSLVETKIPASAGTRRYWVAKEAKDRVFAGNKIHEVKTTRGSKLVGLRYTGAFDDLPSVKSVANGKNDGFHTVIATDNRIMPITTTEGTGLVHTAVSAGTEDFMLGKKLGLPMIPVINDDASYMDGFGEFSGLNAKKHPELIIDYLTKLDSLGKHFYFKVEKYTHRYPACWRCKTELVWKVTDEWYVAMDKQSIANSNLKSKNSKLTDWEEEGQKQTTTDTRTLRERMKAVAEKINWIPGFGLDREMDWLTNMHDWLISKKNRYWGLALPIWECSKCKNFEVIGSKEELDARSVTGKLKGTPHKPQIDKVKIDCSKCGEEMTRIEPVGNPWLDAGIVPFSTISENNKACGFAPSKTKPSYLVDREEWKKWFPADFITESFPGQFKNWFYSLIAMSTVLEDTNPFKTVLGYATCVGEDARPMHKSWGNAIEFNEAADKIGADVMRWVYARTNPAENLLFGYKIADEVRRKFHLNLWNIYNFFVTYANLDGWRPIAGHGFKLTNHLDAWLISRLRETIFGVTSSLDNYDAKTATENIEKFVNDMSLWYIRRSRNRVDLTAEDKQDKDNFYSTTHFVLINLCKILAPFNPFISDFMYTNLTKLPSIHLVDWPDEKQVKMMGKWIGTEKGINELLKQMQVIRTVVEKAHAIRKEKNIPVRQPLNSYSTIEKPVFNKLEYLLKDEINVKNIIWNSKSEKFDTKITPELMEEAEVRDLVRKIQDARKNMGLNLTQTVNVWVEKVPTSTELTQWMKKKAQITKLEVGIFKVVKSSEK